MVKIEFRHSGIVVDDLEKSLFFYKDILGYTIVNDAEESGNFISTILGLENVRVRTVKMKPNKHSNSLIELLEFKSHGGDINAEKDYKLYRIGPTHVALTVEDLSKLYIKMLDSGIEFISEPQISADGYAKVAFCKAPEGTYFELVQVL